MQIGPRPPIGGPARGGAPDPLKVAYDRAVRRFGSIEGVEIQVCASPGSGGKPVVALRHREGKADRCHIHFHGDQLYDGDVNYEGKIGPCLERAWQKDKDTVLLLPEANNEDQAPRSDWNNIRDLRLILKDGMKALGLGVDELVHSACSGHSAGGSVIAKAIARTPAEVVGFDRLELYDAAVSSTHNSVSDDERARVQRWCQQRPQQFLVVPGIMKSSWLTYVDRSRWTEKAEDHWSPLWDSLGQEREPAPL